MREPYKIYKSEVILSNRLLAKEHCNITEDKFHHRFGEKVDSTWSYHDYNVFNLSCSSTFFYELYHELVAVARDYIGDDRPAWMCAWLNAHTQDTVLDWHDHKDQFHGYIVIDNHHEDYNDSNPIKTKTVFRNWEVYNELGNIYIGHSSFNHKVEVLEPFEGKRHTVAFQITTEADQLKHFGYHPLPKTCLANKSGV